MFLNLFILSYFSTVRTLHIVFVISSAIKSEPSGITIIPTDHMAYQSKSYTNCIKAMRMVCRKEKDDTTRKSGNDVTIFKFYVTISQFQVLILVLSKWKKTMSIGQKYNVYGLSKWGWRIIWLSKRKVR